MARTHAIPVAVLLALVQSLCPQVLARPASEPQFGSCRCCTPQDGTCTPGEPGGRSPGNQADPSCRGCGCVYAPATVRVSSERPQADRAGLAQPRPKAWAAGGGEQPRPLSPVDARTRRALLHVWTT